MDCLQSLVFLLRDVWGTRNHSPRVVCYSGFFYPVCQQRACSQALSCEDHMLLFKGCHFVLIEMSKICRESRWRDNPTTQRVRCILRQNGSHLNKALNLSKLGGISGIVNCLLIEWERYNFNLKTSILKPLLRGFLMGGSRKYPYLYHGRHLGIPKGRGGLRRLEF